MKSNESLELTPVHWFEVELHTLRLTRADLAGWPDGMTNARSRMKEECLESVVALNLDSLFPGEDLLLVGTQFAGAPSGDVLAMGPFGYLRLMELKKGTTSLAELQNQVISYGIDRDRLPAWDDRLAQNLPFLPEQIDLRLEGFRSNARAQVLGAGYVRRHTPGALRKAWNKHTRFEKAHLVANALRASRGEPSGPTGLDNPSVSAVTERLYGFGSELLGWSDPGELAHQIIDGKWGCRPSPSGTEFTLVAPGVARQVDAELPLEKRGARFHLIEAELRHTRGARGVTRAVLRWRPVRRTLSTLDLQTATALRKHLQTIHPPAAGLQRDPACTRLCWHGFPNAFLGIERGGEGGPVLVTRSDSLTEGYAPLKAVYREGVRELGRRVVKRGGPIRRKGRALYAPWDLDDVRPAAELAVEYYDVLNEQGFFELERFAWARRPAE